VVFIFAETKNFVVLQTSDLHGNIFPVDYASGNYSNVGLGKLAQLIINEKKGNDTLLIDSGDLIQGTPLEYYHARIENDPEDPMMKVMNYLGYDVGLVGNHEFNYGPEILNKAIAEAEFPILGANIVFKDTDIPYFKPYEIFEKDGIKIAVLGLTTKYIPNWEDAKNIADFEFLDPVETAGKYIPELRAEADILIVSYHGGFEKDLKTGQPTEELTGENQGYEILTKFPEIDIMLTGHQHRKISEMFGDTAVVQPSNWGKYLSKITVTLDNQSGKWKITGKKPELIPVDSSIKEDKTVLSMVQDYEDKVQKWLDIPVGKSEGDFYVYDPLETRMKDNALIEFVNRVQMKYTGADISSTALFSDSVKGWKSGEITLRDINGVYIYANTLKVIEVTGQDIKDAIEKTATYFAYKNKKIEVNDSWINPKPQQYNYDMWEGIDYVIDPENPEGQRVVGLYYKGKPLDMKEKYQIVLNNYRAGGGGNYNMFKGKPVVKEVMVEVSELMSDYILNVKNVNAETDKNWFVGLKDTYKVEKGDTLYKIASKYGIKTYEIAGWNNIKNENVLKTGEILTIYKPYVK